MDWKIETITPKMAENYLCFNRNNRGIRKGLVLQYARDMKSGNWKLTHQGIAFNCDGTLLDGQHRLLAIIESGVAVKMTVTRGVDTNCQLNMDDHGKRTAAESLSLARGELITQAETAIIRAAVELQGQGRQGHLTKSELDRLIDEFSGSLNFCQQFYAAKKQRGVTAAPAWGSIALAWFYVQDLDRLHKFCRMFCGLDMITEESDRAAQTLREWMLRTGVKSAGQRIEAFQKSQRAIVAFMGYKKIEKLYGTSVYFPWPLIDPIRR